MRRSKEYRHGLRSPSAASSNSPGRAGSSRSSLPSGCSGSCAVRSGSPAPPPSPMPRYRRRVRAEEQQATVVVGGEVVDLQQLLGALGVGHGRVAGRPPVSDRPRVALGVGVVDVEGARVGVLGVEGDREQPLLAAAGDQVAQVEEDARLAAVDRDPLDPAALLDHVEVVGVAARRLGDVDRLVEVADSVERDAALAVADRAGAGARLRGRGRRRRRGGLVGDRGHVVLPAAGGEQRR